MKKKSKKELTNPRLKNLKKDLEKIQKAEKYLESEKKKLMKVKEKLRIKIKKETEILTLKSRINRLRSNKR